MTSYFLVFIGGGLGSMARFGIGQLLARFSWQFPLATFAANIISCLILGYLIGFSTQHSPGASYKLLLMTGFCGGFSTFSTFSAETLLLLQQGQYGYAFLNIGASLMLCLLAVYLGIKAAY